MIGGAIEHISGMPIIENSFVGETKRVFTKKQTRKFKNRRWVKKYKKKYSHMKFIPGMMMVQGNLLAHPALIPTLEKYKAGF